MISTPNSPMLPSLESVLCTEELDRRPARPPDYASENRALAALAQALANSQPAILQILAETILELYQCGSAGVSLLTEDGTRFYWPAVAGQWRPHLGGGTPRDFGPCGDVLDCNRPLLFRHLERRYTYFQPVMPAAAEALLAPFYVEGKAVGTIWAVSHDARPEARKFDREDLRMLVSLGTFAAAAYRVMEHLRALREKGHERQESQLAMRDMNEALLVSSVRQHELAEQAQQAERKMHDSEVRYRRLFESANDGVLILDARTGKISDANAGMGDLMETEADELVGKELWEIGFLDDKSASEAAMRELHEKGSIRYENLPLESKRGRRIDVEVVASVYTEDRQSAIQCNVRDISERTRLAKQTEEQAAALADMDRRKDEFLAMLAHELRNPLAPISNAVQLLGLHRKNEDQLQQKARNIIERQVGQLARLVDDLLEVSRITTGRIHLQRECLALNGIVQHGVETVGPLIGQRHHVLKVSLPAQPILVHADAARLEQVVVNLLSNAAKYTPDGGNIFLTVEQEGAEGVLRLRDTGIGIAPDLLPRVFDLFTQAEGSLDRSQGGLGIGLCLVQRLVEMHGGRVEAYSALGRGSEFVVRLPLLTTPEAPLPSAAKDPSAATGQNLRVLVVDDNVDSAQSIALLLQASGHDVRMAHDGPAAVAAALDYRPRVVLLDLGLPGLNGLAVAKQLRQQPSLGNVVLVAVTGYGQESDRRRSLEAGFDHHLVKPVDFGKVQRVLATVSEKAT